MRYWVLKAVHQEQVVRTYYNQCKSTVIPGAGLIGTFVGDQLHPPMVDDTGVWFSPRRWREGILASTNRLIGYAGIRSDDTVLEVGCGVGGVARQIVCERDAYVVGVTNSHQQAISANTLNATFSITPKPLFIVGDAEKLPFATGSFSCIVCVNMAYHVNSKLMFAELARVAQAGARLAFDDWYVTESITAAELKRLRNDWSSPKGFHTRHEYESALREVGWEICIKCELSHIGRYYANPQFAEAARQQLLPVAESLYNGWGPSALDQLLQDFAFLGTLYEAGKFGYVQMVAVKH